MLIVLGGLPGTGKTTIARLLAQRLNAVHLRVDTIEQALRSSGMLKADVGPAGYIVAYRLAEDNLRLGRTVVADCVNPLAVTRDAWLSVGQSHSTNIMEVEVICSDTTEHRRRVEARTADIEGLQQPSWQDVVDRHYESWSRSPIRIDTAISSAEQAVDDLVDLLAGRGLRA
ncbi:AAA family ATPase [Pararhizobium sp. LjRoot238]